MAFSGLVMKIKTRENRYRKLGTPPQQPGLIRHFQDCFFVIFLKLILFPKICLDLIDEASVALVLRATIIVLELCKGLRHWERREQKQRFVTALSSVYNKKLSEFASLLDCCVTMNLLGVYEVI